MTALLHDIEASRTDTFFLSSDTFDIVHAIIITQNKYGTSIAEREQKGKITLFPNPVQDELTIQFADMEMISAVSIYSVTGQLVYQSSMFNNDNGEMKINVSDLASGVYFAKFHSSKHIISKLFIKE